MTTIATVMTTNVRTVDMDATLRQVQEIFNKEGFHHLVVTEAGKAVGVISDRDVLKNLSPFIGKMDERKRDLACLNKKAHQVMQRRLISVEPSTPTGDAVETMLQSRVSCLPVLDDANRCVGIVSWRDLLPWAIDRVPGCKGQSESNAA